jgi:hypothetical protein
MCGNIWLSPDAVCELEEDTVILTIAKADIVALSVSFGRASDRPVAQLVAGVLLCAVGCFLGVVPLSHFVSAMVRGDVIREPLFTLRPFAYAAPAILLGLWLLWGVFHARHFLLVHTKDGVRRLPLSGTSASAVLAAAKALGYPVTDKTEKP